MTGNQTRLLAWIKKESRGNGNGTAITSFPFADMADVRHLIALGVAVEVAINKPSKVRQGETMTYRYVKASA